MVFFRNGRERREYWQHAAKLLLEAAGGGSTEAVTDQLVMALMLDGTLDLGPARQPPSRSIRGVT